MKTQKIFSLIGLALLIVVSAACSSPSPAAPSAPPAVTVVQAQPTAAPTQSPAPTTAPSAGMPNPASVFCQQQGGKTEIRKDAKGGEVGYCVFPDKSECEEWAFQRGECKPGAKPTTAASSADPFAYCATVGNVDAPDTRWTGPKMPDAIVRGVMKASGAATDAPVDVFAQSSFWRCMNSKVYACTIGANLPCQEKADTSKTPSAAMNDYCTANPKSDFIPAVVTGRATVYDWKCVNGKPEIAKELFKPDARGFISDFWYEIAPTTSMPGSGIANPASTYCVQQGGTVEIRKDAKGGEVGYCVFPDKSECEEWAFMRGECKPGAKPTTALRLTKADAGKKVDLAVGSVLELALDGNPTTGYTWKVMSGNDALLKQMGDATFTPQSGLIGAPGVEVFKFQAIGTGSVTLKLGYKQWWDDKMQPNPTFEVTVNIGGSAVGPTLQVAAKDNGKTLEIAKGGTVVVTLEGNPGSTGYLWGLEAGNDAVLKPAGDYKFTSTSNMPGAGGKFEFRFTAAGAGTATLKFANKRPWELNDPKAETFSVTVNVK